MTVIRGGKVHCPAAVVATGDEFAGARCMVYMVSCSKRFVVRDNQCRSQLRRWRFCGRDTDIPASVLMIA